MDTLIFGEQLGAGSSVILYLVLIAAMLYFFLWRPQKKQMSQRQEMLGGLRVGDRVSTVGGILGEVRALRENEVYIQVADGLVLEFQRQAISGVIREEEASEETEQAEETDLEPKEPVATEDVVEEKEAVDPDFACIKEEK